MSKTIETPVAYARGLLEEYDEEVQRRDELVNDEDGEPSNSEYERHNDAIGDGPLPIR